MWGLRLTNGDGGVLGVNHGSGGHSSLPGAQAEIDMFNASF